jgi:hypothetical protein
MEGQPSPPTISLTELILRTRILALKVLIPMLWLQSKLSPIQFLIGGTALLLVVFLFDTSSSRDHQPGPSQQSHPHGSAVPSSGIRAEER